MPKDVKISTRQKTQTVSEANQPKNAPHSYSLAAVQRAQRNPESLMHADIMQLQRTIGNQAVMQLFKGKGDKTVQDRVGLPETEVERDWSLETVGDSEHSASSYQGLPVQCVGGKKFGLQATGVDEEGLEQLKAVQAEYKKEVKAAKETAIKAFQSGDMADEERQNTYTDALAAAEMTPEGLFERLKGDLTHNGDIIYYKGQEIARVLRGAQAYQQTQAAQNGVAAIYKRHTLAGLSEKEYVDVSGEKLRRYAWRGITPTERADYKTGRSLKPMNAGKETEGLTGYKFDAITGQSSEREHNVQEGKVTDLEWLNDHAGTALDAVPRNPELLAFMQTRKGVGKLLSATSTGKQITSNHGEPFVGFGRIKIDLARVPADKILHHYKQAPFDASALNGAVGKKGYPSHKLQWETDRANETVLRNRELVLKEIPNAAVSNLEDTPQRRAYEQEFRSLYIPKFQEGYQAALDESGINFAVNDPPILQDFPFNEGHYGQLRARQDFLPGSALKAGRDRAAPLVVFGRAYVESYKMAWVNAYEEAACETKAYQDQIDELDIEEIGSFQIEVPEAPEPEDVPQGDGEKNGRRQGNEAGKTDGKAAGEEYGG